MSIELRSDNSAGISPAILAAIAAANHGSALAYGGDAITGQLQDRVRDVFEHPGARVFCVASGTAANALSLAALTPPWGAVLCHDSAHILNSEAGATSAFSGGALMTGIGGADFRVSAGALEAALAAVRWGDNHQSQPAVLSLTQPTDMGTVYPATDVAALARIAAGRGLRVHLDGARLAGALVATGATPAEMTWRAGVDVVSLGATKNGAMSAEAIVCFDDAPARELVYRTKRAGHVTSKMRYQSAQILAYLTDDLWLKNAANANDRMAELAAGLEARGIRLAARAQANMAFADLSGGLCARLERAGVLFYRMGPWARFVTSWETTREDIDRVLAALD